jgi:hypothetical protein
MNPNMLRCPFVAPGARTQLAREYQSNAVYGLMRKKVCSRIEMELTGTRYAGVASVPGTSDRNTTGTFRQIMDANSGRNYFPASEAHGTSDYTKTSHRDAVLQNASTFLPGARRELAGGLARAARNRSPRLVRSAVPWLPGSAA